MAGTKTRPKPSATATAPFVTRLGRPHPLGATVHPDGVNFSVFSQHAWSIELLLFDANAFGQHWGSPTNDDTILRDRVSPSTDPSGLVQEEVYVVAVHGALQVLEIRQLALLRIERDQSLLDISHVIHIWIRS
jgi:pullulanase/glycogen debranching enzyme